MPISKTRPLFPLAASAVLLLCGATAAQYAERGALLGDGTPDLDVSGRSVKNPRVRAVHTTDADDPLLEGGTAYFLEKDPFLAYQLGRNLNFREFRPRDGVFSATIAGFGGPMVDGTTAKITSNNQTSCLGCHNIPNGNPGGGANFAKDSGRGRNSPHYFGAGIMEMLAIQTRTKLLAQIDADGDGWVSVSEAGSAPSPLLVTPAAGLDALDYGSAALTGGTTGKPQLNPIFRVWYGKETGPGVVTQVAASSIDGVNATHYNFEMIVWGWGQRVPPSGLNPTNRAFLWDPFVSHSGLDAHDPSTLDDPDGDGVSLPTLAGAVQFPATHRAPDAGLSLDPAGFSLDDPDGDGHLTEISEGDLDLAEWFMLNAPRPAFLGSTNEYARGVKAMTQMGCTACHTPAWTIDARDARSGLAGDRRLFDFETGFDKQSGRLEGRIVPLFDKIGDTYQRRFGSFEVAGLLSDLRHHDMGEGFTETAYDGSTVTAWRTPPLWGVGSGFPWGHDGASLTLTDAILRHDGEGAASKAAWIAASPNRRAVVLDFLDKLRLYDVESLPADVDGDGVVSDAFIVAGIDTGLERFNAEWLFETPVEIQGQVTGPDGVPVTSFAAMNLSDAYGLQLSLRVDSDLDGWPDVWDADDLTVGYRDGVH